MNYLKSWKESIRAQFAQNSKDKKDQTFSALMINFGQIVWHFEAMNWAIIEEKYDVACEEAEQVTDCWNYFSIIFCDLSFASSDKQYVPELQRIINFRGDYGHKASDFVKDIHEKLRQKIQSQIPEYVTFEFEINRSSIDTTPQCDDETWRALGMFFAYENLVSMRPPRHIGEKYVYFMERIARNRLGVSSHSNENPLLVSPFNTVSIPLDNVPVMDVVDSRFRIEERLKSARTTVDSLAYSAAVESCFVLSSGFTHECL